MWGYTVCRGMNVLYVCMFYHNSLVCIVCFCTLYRHENVQTGKTHFPPETKRTQKKAIRYGRKP